MSTNREGKTLDGIKPVASTAKPYQWTAPSTAAKAVAKPKSRTLASLKPQSTPVRRPSQHNKPKPKLQTSVPSSASRQPKPMRRAYNWIFIIHIAIAAVFFAALCFFAERAVTTGQLLILAYAVYALALRVPSRITFLIVLASFAAVVLHLTVRPDTELVNTFSIYAFLLLIVSAISLGKEGRRQTRFE